MINFNVDPVELNKQLAKMNDEVLNKIDLQRIYRGIGEVLQTTMEDQFKEEGAYLGSGWDSLAASTIKARERKGKWPGSILQVTGRLVSSFTYEVNGNTLTFGTNVEYAKYLHFGTKRMPARPLFSSLLTEEVKKEIRGVISRSLG